MARAVTDGQATILSRIDFEQGLLRDPQRCRNYLRSLFERLRSLAARVEEHDEDFRGIPTPVASRVVLHPLTRKAAEVLPAEGLLLSTFPFRIGRAAEAHEQDSLDLNDLWLLDTQPFHVSRNHLAIDVVGANRFVVRDRGSNLGTIVNERRIGGRSGLRWMDLEEGDNVLILGGAKSPYQFRLMITGSS
jgi:hypothetical protein